MNAQRSFAIIPAAGQSRRMGRHKLLLPWHGSTVIEQVLRAWLASNVSQVVVVVRKDDHGLLAICRDMALDTVCPEVDPQDMKASVQCGLRYLAEQFSAAAADVWLLAPADLPRLSASLINQVLASHNQDEPAIVVPTVAERRGHPVLFPWSVATDVFALGRDEGVNRLLDKCPTRQISVPSLDGLEDVDTPTDYRRLLAADRKAE